MCAERDMNIKLPKKVLMLPQSCRFALQGIHVAMGIAKTGQNMAFCLFGLTWVKKKCALIGILRSETCL